MAQIGQLPIGIFDEGGKFEPKQEFIDAARAKALEEGKKYYGDATNFEIFRDSVLNLPDATINFLARGAEGTGELAAGIVSLVMKGGQLATTTDPDKITQILSEPSFTKYMGAFRDKIPTPNLYESDISEMEDAEKAFGTAGYYTAPLPMVPAGVLAAGAKSVAVPAGRGIAQLAEDIVKSFTRGDSSFRASAGGKKTGVKTIDEMIEDKTLKTGDELTQDPQNLMAIERDRNLKITQAKANTSKQNLFNTIINNEDSVKILEDVRTGKISYVDGANQIEKLIDKSLLRYPDKGAGFKGFSKDKNRDIHTQKFTELVESYKSKLKSSENYKKDIFDVDIISKAKDTRTKKATLATPQKKKVALEVLELVKKDTSSDPFGVKYRNAYKKLMLGDEAKIPDDYFRSSEYLTSETTAKNILDYQGVKVTPIENPNTVVRSPDGTTMIISKSKFDEGPLKSFQNIKIGQKIEGDQAKRNLKNDALINGENQSFNQVKSSILKDEQVSSKMIILKDLFEETSKKTHVYSFDHIQSPKFGGGNGKDNLIFIMEGPHNNIKNLPPSKTSVDDIVKPKSRFENEVHKKGKGLVDAVKNGNLERAKELSEEINKLQNNFKNTYTSVDFVVGQPYVAVKTGDKTANFITYAEDLKLTPDQIKQVNELLPTYSYRPNAGLSVEESIDRLVTMYGELASLKRGKLTVDEAGQASPMREGGLATMEYMTRPLV